MRETAPRGLDGAPFGADGRIDQHPLKAWEFWSAALARNVAASDRGKFLLNGPEQSDKGRGVRLRDERGCMG
jgi:hypothetical protein